MLLRRITQHVRNQNWFAVFLDFVIVVVGVFIGIQVSNWNDEKTEISNANKMLSGLVHDLENEKQILEILKEYWLTTRSYGEEAVLGFEGHESISDEQFVISAYQTSQVIVPTSNRATYEQMVSSGNINIAGSEKLRHALVVFYIRDWEKAPHNLNPTPYRANIRRAIPHFIQTTIRQNCGDQFIKKNSIDGIVLPKTCDLEIDDEAFELTAKELRDRKDLLMDLNEHMSNLDAKLGDVERNTKVVVEMLELAKSEEDD